MNVNDNKFKPQLSRHELILDRYKTILKSSSTEILINKQEEKTFNNSVLEKKIDSRINSVVNNSGIKSYLNDMISTSTTSRNYNSYGIDSSCNQIDQIEMIKAKYTMKMNNNTNTNNSEYKNQVLQNNFSSNFHSMHKDSPSNSFINIIQSNMQDNSKNLEIESIKSKYSNNLLINTIPKESSNFTNMSKTSKFDDILSKYKQKENITLISNNIENKAKDNEANGQSNEVSKINFIRNSFEPNLLDRINSIEEKLNKIQTTFPDYDKTVKKEYFMNRVKEIVKTSDITNKSDIDLDRNKINETIENTIKQIKYLKDKNIYKIEEHEKRINKEDNSTFQLINQIIENVTGKLFTHNEFQKQSKETENEIKLMPNKAKFFKLKASVPNTVKKKIQTFEEFINSDTENK